MKWDWEYVKSQLEALPYILAACAVGGAMWLIASMLIIICE